jgi:hypothetical protein
MNEKNLQRLQKICRKYRVLMFVLYVAYNIEIWCYPVRFHIYRQFPWELAGINFHIDQCCFQWLKQRNHENNCERFESQL